MPRKLILLMSILALLLACVPACAESIFTLPTEEEAAVPAPMYAPNYGLQMNVAPVSTTTLEDGSLQLVYKPVSDDNFLAFGTLLGERGFAVVNRTASGGELTMTVQNEDMAFTVAYQSSSHRMAVTYPEGMQIEQPVLVNPFRDSHVEVELGETLRAVVNGEPIFDITFTSILKGENARSIDASNDYVVGFSLDVLDNNDVDLLTHFYPNIHYITHLNQYHYYATRAQCYRDSKPYRSFYSWNSNRGRCTHNNYADSLNTYPDCYLSLHTHSRVYQANDGIVAMTFTLPGYELPFVLYLRGGN